MNIDFGRWRLTPVDALNWELCHWHAPTKGKNRGTEQWNRLGHYYQWNTIANAILFAADQEMREKDGTMAFGDALKEWKTILDAFTEDIKETLGTHE